MGEDFLSQEEIDALLGGNVEGTEPSEPQEKIRPFDVNNLEKIIRGGIPGLDIIFERWVNEFRDAVRSVIYNVNLVTKEKIYTIRYGDFMPTIPLPAAFNIFTMKPLKGNALLILDSRLVFVIISVMFGGPAEPFKVEGREFTRIERRVIEQIVDIALETLERVWSQIYPIKCEFVRMELNPQLVNIASNSEKVIVVECSMDIDGFEAPFFFTFPQSMLMPLHDILFNETGILEVDLGWKTVLLKKLQKVIARLWVELDKKTIKVRDILELKPGDIIILNKQKTDKTVKIYVENAYKFKGKLQPPIKGYHTVRIEEKIYPEEV